MDHIPLPHKPLLDPIEVPYRCTEPYDGSSMLEYPERNGWEIQYAPSGISYLFKEEKPSDNQLESFIQNYLYFGLLHDIFGNFVDIRNFVTQNESGRYIITTAALEDTIKKWVDQVEQQQDPESMEETDWWVHTHKLLSHTWKVALNTKMICSEGAVDERIWFSIAILVESVQQVLLDLFRNPDLYPPSKVWRWPNNPEIGNFILDEMLKKGWCIYDVRRIDLTTQGAATLYFIANLQPTRPGYDHSKCTEGLCVWMTTNESYKTRHGSHDCHCDQRFSGIEVVREILEGEEIPLIQEIESREESGSPNFRIITSDSSTNRDFEFVAISHVWAEGLGNPLANELPCCSLKWISQLVNSLDKKEDTSSIPFWIDTLCVPITPHNLWLRAMNRLRKPYQDASAVLVLDSYLYEQDSSKLSALEIWARVLCCTWSRRLWTFQEGRLAKFLVFQFADRAIQLEQTYMSFDDWRRSSVSIIRGELFNGYRSHNVIRNFSKMVPDYPWTIAKGPELFRAAPTVWDMRVSLQARSVSMSTDEALCLFCNMGFDMELVTGLEVEEYMPKFWSLIKDIPVGLVFSTAREKLSRPGLRWAPKSFMGDLDTGHWYVEQEMVPRIDGFPTSEGLEIQVPAFLFDPELLRHDDSFDTLFSGSFLHVQDSTDRSWYFVQMYRDYWNQDRKDDPKSRDQLAILTHTPINHVDEDKDGDPFSFHPGVIAVIGVITEPLSKIYPLKIEIYRHAILHKSSRAMQEYNNMVQNSVERFVMEELGYTEEHEQDEEGRYAETWRQPEYPEGEEPEENIDNFELTDERRHLCQTYCTKFAEADPVASEIALRVGRNQAKLPEDSFKQFGSAARFQLQMRRRNRITRLAQTQVWCID